MSDNDISNKYNFDIKLNSVASELRSNTAVITIESKNGKTFMSKNELYEKIKKLCDEKIEDYLSDVPEKDREAVRAILKEKMKSEVDDITNKAYAQLQDYFKGTGKKPNDSKAPVRADQKGTGTVKEKNEPEATKTTSNTGVKKTESVTKVKQKNDVSEWTITNVSYSGADMHVTAECTVAGKTIRASMGALQTLSYSVYDKMVPIHALGNVNAKDYVHTHRYVAGSMVFAVFDQHWAKNILLQYAKAAGYKDETKLLMDEIPPLDVTVSMSNEYGSASRLAIYGVRFYNEGMVMSINDVYTENTFEYVAMNVDYLESVRHISLDGDTSEVKPDGKKSSSITEIKTPNDGGKKQESIPRINDEQKKTNDVDDGKQENAPQADDKPKKTNDISDADTIFFSKFKDFEEANDALYSQYEKDMEEAEEKNKTSAAKKTAKRVLEEKYQESRNRAMKYFADKKG